MFRPASHRPCLTYLVVLTAAAVDKLGYSLAVHPTDGSVAVGGLNGEIRRVALRRERP